jgi:hypothetical protein
LAVAYDLVRLRDLLELLFLLLTSLMQIRVATPSPMAIGPLDRPVTGSLRYT